MCTCGAHAPARWAAGPWEGVDVAGGCGARGCQPHLSVPALPSGVFAAPTKSSVWRDQGQAKRLLCPSQLGLATTVVGPLPEPQLRLSPQKRLVLSMWPLGTPPHQAPQGVSLVTVAVRLPPSSGLFRDRTNKWTQKRVRAGLAFPPPGCLQPGPARVLSDSSYADLCPPTPKAPQALHSQPGHPMDLTC